MFAREIHRSTSVVLLLFCGLTAFASDAPLADAVESGDESAVRELLAGGADLDAPQADGMTALHWAAYNSDAAIVELLLEHKADPRAPNRYGVTPLSLACQNGDETIAKMLLDAGADPNTALPGGETALMTAARTGRIGPVKALLTRGAEVDAAEEGGQTALMWAAAEGHADVVELLIEFGADFRKRLESGFTPLLFAVREGRLEVVRTLLDAGADPNEFIDPLRRSRRPRPGTSALMLAVENAHYEVGALLLDAGADPNLDRTGFTVLHVIPSVRNPGIGDNDPPPPGSGSMTSIELVEDLIEHGADIDARMTENVNLGNTRLNKRGATTFLLAAQSADAELLRALARLGADTTATNEDGSPALMIATGIGTRSPGEDAGTEDEIIETVELLLELGADINAVDDKGETAMHGAAYKNTPGVIELLAEKGADIAVWNRENVQGWTPLTIAYGYRFGNFKPSPPTVDALKRVMLAAGVTPPPPPKSGGVSEYKR